METFRATYKPRILSDKGAVIAYDEENTETVLVLDVVSQSGVNDYGVHWQDWEAVFINSHGQICTAPIDCFSECNRTSSGARR